ncbi:DUF500-domain-containing protein, partial [Hyaloscypha bicolor E]
ASEWKRSSKILSSFIDPREGFVPDRVIPPSILANAKGLAIITVVKAGFLGSTRYGNGVVVGRLANGNWSAPTAIALTGAGFGGQIGFELTDFVLILNDIEAVWKLSQQGSLTLGRNVSLATGPLGENAEAAGTLSSKCIAGSFCYSKMEGMFAVVSLDGLITIGERIETNDRLYGQRYTASQLMGGSVRPPLAAISFIKVLNDYTNVLNSTVPGGLTMSEEPIPPNLQGLSSETVSLEDDQVVALIDFDAEGPGHLGFKNRRNCHGGGD